MSVHEIAFFLFLVGALGLVVAAFWDAKRPLIACLSLALVAFGAAVMVSP